MVYESRPGETFVLGASTWRIEDITFERVTVTPAPGEPGKMPFWHGDRPGRPLELGRALGAFVREHAGGRTWRAMARLRDDYALDELAARNLRAVHRRAGRGHRRRARRPHDRRRALPRRDRRLAGVRAQPVRHAGARAVGDGDRAPPGRPLRPAGRVDVGRRRHRAAAAGVGRRAAARGVPDRPRRHRRAGRRRRCRRRRCSRRASASARGGRCCCRAVGPIGARRCGSSASGRPTCWPWRRSTRRSRSCSRRRASACRTCSTCRPCATCSARSARARSAWSTSTPPSRRRWRRACCSTGSPPTCTRATPRSPSGGPPRWHSTATCCATCSAPRSCASCSTPACSPTSSSTCSASPTVGGPAHADELHDVLRRVGDLTLAEVDLRCEESAESAVTARSMLDVLLGERRAIELVVAGRGPLCGRRRRRPLPRRARLRAPARAAAGVHRSGAATAGGPGRTLRPHARPVRRTRRGRALRRLRVACARRPRRARGRRPTRARRVPSRRIAAGVVRRRRASPAAATVAGGVAPRGRAGRAGGTRARSSPRGRASAPRGGVRNRSSRRSACWPARRSWRRRSSVTCWRRASPTIARRCSTSCAPPARWCGSARERSARTTAASGCASPTSSPCSPRAGSSATRPTGRPITASAPCSLEGGRASGVSCGRAWSGRRTTSCSRRSGTWCGPAR